MLIFPDAREESRIVGVPLPERRLGRGFRAAYGAFQVAASYCGFSVPPSPFYGEWQHGWHSPEKNFHPEMVVGSNGLSMHKRRTLSYLVARKDQEDFLRSHGYLSVHSVGLPIIYQPPQEVERLPNSLLVMPVHSLEYIKINWNFQQYLSEIEAIRDRFSTVVACVNGSCYRQGYWVKAFQERGIPVVTGADVSDANSYKRLAVLFGRFDFMTTNSDGSHVVYAPLFGIKPSIYGTIPTRRMQDYEKDPLYQNNPEMLAKLVELRSSESIRRHLAHLFAMPWEAQPCQEWANFQAGMQCKKEPKELSQLLGWDRKKLFAVAARELAQKIAHKPIQLARRMQNPGKYAKAVCLDTLKHANPGELVRTEGIGLKLESLNGPRLAWELENGYFGDFYQVQVNPADGPALDLAPCDGASVLALAKNHPFRRIFYLQAGGDEGERLKRNLRSEAERSCSLSPLGSSPMDGLISSADLFASPVWDFIEKEHKKIIANSVVLRISVDGACWEKALDRLHSFSRCRLLFVECKQPENYLGSLLTRLKDLCFSPRLNLIRFGSFRQPVLFSEQDTIFISCMRSGLMLDGSIRELASSFPLESSDTPKRSQ